MSSNLQTQKFFSCSCYTEGILITDWERPEDSDIFLSILSHGLIRPKRGIIERIKYAWEHLTTGKIWEDEIVLSPEVAKDLGEYLINRAKIKEIGNE